MGTGEIRSHINVVYRCTYHVVWCPKCRRKVIDGGIDTRLKQIIREVCAEREAPIVELETMPDHVHLLVSCDPQYGIHPSSKESKAARSGFCGKSSRPSNPECLRSGQTRTSSRQSAGQPWMSSKNMCRTNETYSRPYLPTAKAGGFPGSSG